MATRQKRQRKSRLIAKKELAYLLSRLRTIDATIMRASVLKLPRGLSRKWPSCIAGRDAVTLWLSRRCVSSSLQIGLFTWRCGVTDCLSLSLSCSRSMAIVNHVCAFTRYVCARYAAYYANADLRVSYENNTYGPLEFSSI